MTGPTAFSSLLAPPLLAGVSGLSTQEQGAIIQLLSSKAGQRLRGVDGVFDSVSRSGCLSPSASVLCPLLLQLATSPTYPEGSLLLTRLFGLLSRLDDPPRSHPDRADALVRASRGRLSDLLRCAAKSKDPASNRAAAFLCAHFPSVDSRTELHLIALRPGAPDEESRARIVYHLCLVQLGLERTQLHPSAERALRRPSAHLESAAVALAIRDSEKLAIRDSKKGAPSELLALSRSRLSHLSEFPHLTKTWPDPRRWGAMFPALPRDPG